MRESNVWWKAFAVAFVVQLTTNGCFSHLYLLQCGQSLAMVKPLISVAYSCMELIGKVASARGLSPIALSVPCDLPKARCGGLPDVSVPQPCPWVVGLVSANLTHDFGPGS